MSVDQRVDALFTLAPQEFTSARDQLVKDLRQAGDAINAAEVKGLRRPTRAAWALNHLSRQDPEGLHRLREAGETLARQQRRAMSGLDPSGLRAAHAMRRQITDQLLQRALAVLRDGGVAPDPHADAVRNALDAAALDAEAGEALLEGRLSRPPEPPSGFGDLSALSPVASDPSPDADADALDRRLAAARRRLEAATTEAHARKNDADADAEHAQDLAEDVQRLERELTRTRRCKATADTRAQASRERAEEAEADLARRQEEAAQAEADAATQS